MHIDFLVKVKDAAAATELVASGAMAEDKLNAQLVLQVCVVWMYVCVNTFEYVCEYIYVRKYGYIHKPTSRRSYGCVSCACMCA